MVTLFLLRLEINYETNTSVHAFPAKKFKLRMPNIPEIDQYQEPISLSRN